MNTRAEVVLKWGDGEYLFALKAPHIEELQRKCNASIFVIVNRMFLREAYYCDIKETVRLGLIGGGQTPIRALQLVEMYVDGQPLDDPNDPASSYKTAKAVLSAVMVGINELESEEAGKKKVSRSISTPSVRPSSNSGSRPPLTQ